MEGDFLWLARRRAAETLSLENSKATPSSKPMAMWFHLLLQLFLSPLYASLTNGFFFSALHFYIYYPYRHTHHYYFYLHHYIVLLFVPFRHEPRLNPKSPICDTQKYCHLHSVPKYYIKSIKREERQEAGSKDI